ncbi:hypothetical protein CYMTET_41725 [Cymbomonas tetramitiformis]|nr:hypothetical protein CYMTET_41725 [Cymbomonas tetramitiformis]
MSRFSTALRVIDDCLPNGEERFRSRCKAAITRTVANRHSEETAQASDLVELLFGVYEALSDASFETANALGWCTLRDEWCVQNASRVRDFMEWTLRRHGRLGDASSYEHRLKEYLRWRWAPERRPREEAGSDEASLTLLDRMICVASVGLLRGEEVPDELLTHYTEATGMCASRLREALRKSAALERTTVDIWWLRATDGCAKLRRSRWMHNVNHFLFDEYTTLVDAVCDRFGIAVAIGLTEDRASLWKVRHEDAVRCVHFASTRLSFTERSELERTYSTGPYPNVAYHIPLRVARVGKYRDAEEKERDLLTLFEQISTYFHKGESLTRWLCDGVDEILRDLRRRMLTGGVTKRTDLEEIRQSHDAVVGAILDVPVVRACTLSQADARHAFLHTRSDAFAGLAQMVTVTRQRWHADHERLRIAERSLREYVQDLCASHDNGPTDALCGAAPNTKREASFRSRRAQLEAFLVKLARTELRAWTATALSTASPATDAHPSSSPCSLEPATGGDPTSLLACAAYPGDEGTGADRAMHGLFLEGELDRCVEAAAPVGRVLQDATVVRAGRWTLDMPDVNPFYVPSSADRLCRRRYRGVPVGLPSDVATDRFLDDFVHHERAEANRETALRELCEGGDRSDAFSLQAWFGDARFHSEFDCMRRERDGLGRGRDLGAEERANTLELSFWLREYVVARGRWLRPSNILRERLPKEWRRRAGAKVPWADVFVVFLDEFRMAFDRNQKGVSNCVGVESRNGDVDGPFVQYRLRSFLRDPNEVARSLRLVLQENWYVCRRPEGRTIVRVREKERHAAEMVLGHDDIESFQIEPAMSDVREAAFVPGARVSAAGMGGFVRFLFWGLLSSLSAETDRPWSRLVPDRPLDCLPQTVFGEPSEHEVCAADPCWREYLMWVAVETQRIALRIRRGSMGPRISGTGLQLMASCKVYDGQTVSCMLRSIQECRVERTKRVVRPNSSLNTRSMVLLWGLMCTYFPFDEERVLRRCPRATGFVRAPGYDAKRYPYLIRSIVDARGDLRHDVPMCFASPIIETASFSARTRERAQRAGYARVGERRDLGCAFDEDARYLRAANTYCNAAGPSGTAHAGGRIKLAHEGAEQTPLGRIDFLAAELHREVQGDPFEATLSDHDRHSARSVGVRDAHLDRLRGAQFGSRFVHTSVRAGESREQYRLCLEDSHRRAGLGFSELSVDFWSDLEAEDVEEPESLARTRRVLLREWTRNSSTWGVSPSELEELRLDSLRRLVVPLSRSEAIGDILRPLGWTRPPLELSGALVFCRDEAEASPPSAAVRAAVRRLQLPSEEGDRDEDRLLLLRYQLLDEAGYLRCALAAPRMMRLRERLSHRVTDEARSFGGALVHGLHDGMRRLRERPSTEKHAQMLAMVAAGVSAGSEHAEALLLSPRASFRWIVLTGNAALALACLEGVDGLESDFDAVQRVNRLAEHTLTAMDGRPSFASSETFEGTTRTRPADSSSLVEAFRKHATNCLAFAAAFVPKEDRLCGVPTPIDAKDAPRECSNFPGLPSSGAPREASRSRCNRKELELIMRQDTKPSSATNTWRLPKLFDPRFLWLDALADLLASGKAMDVEGPQQPEEATTNPNDEGLETDAVQEIEERNELGMNDLCHESVRDSMRSERSSRSFGPRRYSLQACLRFVGEPRGTWTDDLDALALPVPDKFEGLFRTFETSLPESAHRDFETRAATRTDEAETRVVLELAVRDDLGGKLSTRERPFRFLLDDVITRHALALSEAERSGRVWFPSALRCDLVTNERRVVREKEGGSGVIVCEAGRLRVFRFMMSALVLVHEADDMVI